MQSNKKGNTPTPQTKNTTNSKSWVSYKNLNHIKARTRVEKPSQICVWHKVLTNGARLNAEIKRSLLLSASYLAEDYTNKSIQFTFFCLTCYNQTVGKEQALALFSLTQGRKQNSQVFRNSEVRMFGMRADYYQLL